jgi:hypothetical protein
VPGVTTCSIRSVEPICVAGLFTSVRTLRRTLMYLSLSMMSSAPRPSMGRCRHRRGGCCHRPRRSQRDRRSSTDSSLSRIADPGVFNGGTRASRPGIRFRPAWVSTSQPMSRRQWQRVPRRRRTVGH